jgi:hypothetical protein
MYYEQLSADQLPDVADDGALATDVDDSAGQSLTSDDAWGDWLNQTIADSKINSRCLDCGRTGRQVGRYGHATSCDYAD